MTTIDIHAHAIVPAALTRMAKEHPDYGPTLQTAGGDRYLEYPGRGPLGPLPDAIFDTSLRVADMDRLGVDRQVIAIPPPNFHYHVPAHVGVDFARIQNEELMSLSDSDPERFHLFATLPLQDIPSSIHEIDLIATHPRVRGVQIGSNVDGRDLDHRSLDDIWAKLETVGLPVWIHSDQRSIAGADRLATYYLQNLIGIPLESTIAIAKLIFGGVLDRHPALRFGITHGGGFAPYQIGRWEHGWRVRPEPRANIGSDGPRHFFSSLFFDSLTHDTASLRMLGERMGWDHVMLGSDYPFDMASSDPVGALDGAGLDDQSLSRVLSENAASFLRPDLLAQE
jgi:aminocarboxymuconate-semialdehyde decarboxylase